MYTYIYIYICIYVYIYIIYTYLYKATDEGVFCIVSFHRLASNISLSTSIFVSFGVKSGHFGRQCRSLSTSISVSFGFNIGPVWHQKRSRLYVSFETIHYSRRHGRALFTCLFGISFSSGSYSRTTRKKGPPRGRGVSYGQSDLKRHLWTSKMTYIDAKRNQHNTFRCTLRWCSCSPLFTRIRVVETYIHVKFDLYWHQKRPG